MSFAAHRRANKIGEPLRTGPRPNLDSLTRRLNSLTRDLRNRDGVIPVSMTQTVADHARDIHAAYRPVGNHQTWLLNQLAEVSARLDHCQISIRAQIDDQIDRADLCWDHDRELAVEELAARLPRDPARIARRLRSSAHGCQWLFARWEALGQALLDQGGWNEAQVNMAFHLLGIGPDLRNQYPQINTNAASDDLAQLVGEQLDELHLLRVEALDHLNFKERELSRVGYPLHPSKELLRLQRYETQLRRASNDLLEEFRSLQAVEHAAPLPIVHLEPEPESTPEPPGADSPAPELVPVAVNEPPPAREPRTLDPARRQALATKMITLAGALFAESPAASISITPPTPSAPVLPAPTAPLLNRKARRAQAALARRPRPSAR